MQIVDGVIRDISTSSAVPHSIDCQGDYLISGLVELHTDHLETHYSPRPGVRWGMKAAIQAHDAQIAAAGITTVYDCLRMGREEDDQFDNGEMPALATALAQARVEGRLRVEHCLHLRCEVSAQNALSDFEQFAEDADVGLVSLMDHAPGQRQFTSMDAYRAYHKNRYKMSDEAFDRYVAMRVNASGKYASRHRKVLSAMCADRGLPLASHDDATVSHVEESVQFGVRLAELPTSLEAARASNEAGLGVLMGAPNVVRGRSHSGNVAALELVEHGCMDILSSDYVPASLLQAAFLLAGETGPLSIPEAIATVTINPARLMNLSDRGEVAVGRRADLARVAHYPEQDSAPIVRSVWRQGVRVS